MIRCTPCRRCRSVSCTSLAGAARAAAAGRRAVVVRRAPHGHVVRRQLRRAENWLRHRAQRATGGVHVDDGQAGEGAPATVNRPIAPPQPPPSSNSACLNPSTRAFSRTGAGWTHQPAAQARLDFDLDAHLDPRLSGKDLHHLVHHLGELLLGQQRIEFNGAVKLVGQVAADRSGFGSVVGEKTCSDQLWGR